MVELFRSLFEPHGHVYQDPRYKKDTATYEWNLKVILDVSFSFLLPPISAASEWITSKPSITISYLAGLFDAEGSVGIYPAKLKTSLNVIFYNTNLELLRLVSRHLENMGLKPLRPYLDKKKGFRSPGYHIEMKKDYWRVMLCRFQECQQFLRVLPVRHQEKLSKKALALKLVPGQAWTESGPQVEALRTSIKSARDAFVDEAERLCLAKPSTSLATTQTP
ncbi:MAG TPA: LAGLIDADG family homing endonuclease, partial [Nitrososphaerales archaeon]|nr:LAGLIDADG family homing endonuclease [Nitrososphaerales archaeon]